MAIFGSLATVRAQSPHSEAFAACYAYLEELFRGESSAAARLRQLPVGETHRVELAAGVFALEQVYRSKARADGFFESHQRYIDVQVIFEGDELMEVADLRRSVVGTPYNEERDFIKYEDAAGASVLHLRAGEAAVFFPDDVHMPSLAVGTEGAVVRKVVMKVPVSA